MSKTILKKTLQTATNTTGAVRAANSTCGLEAILDVTVAPGVDTVTLNIYAADPVSGKRVLILSSTARSAVGTERLRIFPGLVAAANVAANDVIGDFYEVEVVHSAATAFTYTVSVSEVNAGA